MEPCNPLELDKIKLMPGFLLVTREKKDKSDGGIILTAAKLSERLSHVGTIILVANCRACTDKNGLRIVLPDDPMPFEIGDRIVFKGYAGIEIKLKDVDDLCYIMEEEDVLATLEDSDEKE